MRMLELAPLLVALFALYALPAATRGRRGIAMLSLGGAGLLALIWFGWAAQLPSVYDRAGALIGVLGVALGLGLGLVARLSVLEGRQRGWSPWVGRGVVLAGAFGLALCFFVFFDLLT